MPVVKKASVKDIPLIRQLTFAIWPQTYSSLLTQDQIDYMLELIYSPAALQKQIETDNCTFIIIYDNDEPVAFASYSEVKPQVWKLHKIYVLASQQGKGTGKFIIHYIVEEIKLQHAKALQLQVKRDNPAQDFYSKLGFTIIATADFDIGNGYFMKDYIMELSV
ncbi:GNAT family N-acetyltransferase [Ferruginibacter sp. SUN106]|uniref:GNAT family N-acetyltransferase n=1 Tax=Ferruginibacter sp. SUN106 TaxID=2978348 RepID=UPI003D369178